LKNIFEKDTSKMATADERNKQSKWNCELWRLSCLWSSVAREFHDARSWKFCQWCTNVFTFFFQGYQIM